LLLRRDRIFDNAAFTNPRQNGKADDGIQRALEELPVSPVFAIRVLAVTGYSWQMNMLRRSASGDERNGM